MASSLVAKIHAGPLTEDRMTAAFRMNEPSVI